MLGLYRDPDPPFFYILKNIKKICVPSNAGRNAIELQIGLIILELLIESSCSDRAASEDTWLVHWLAIGSHLETLTHIWLVRLYDENVIVTMSLFEGILRLPSPGLKFLFPN